jgi:membrane-associated phospholipid phosphatase
VSVVRAEKTAPFLAWPGLNHYIFCNLVGLGWTLVFYVIYGGASYLTGLHSFRLKCDFPFEQMIPFVPQMSLPYIMLFPAMALSAFIIRERRAYWRYARSLTVQLMIAAVFFILIPMRDGYTDIEPTGAFANVFRFADFINLNHNNVPSLHVAFAVTTAYTFASYTNGVITKIFIASFCALIAVSAVLTHQHNLVDVITGYLLARMVNGRMQQSTGRALC